MSKRSFAHLEYGFDDDLVEDSGDDLVDFDDDLLEDSDEQEQVLVEPQAKKLKQSTQQLETNPLRDFEAVVIILDSPHHYHDFYYLNRNLLEIKLQSTSFLISEFSKPKYERFLNETSHEIFCDYMVRSALVRITGELNLSPRIIQLIKRKRFDELPIEMKTDKNVILQLLAKYPNFGELLDYISDDLQNDIQFLLKAFKIVQKNEEITLPKMKLSIAIDWMKMDNSLFQIIPNRLKKKIEFIPFIVSLLEEDLSVVEELWMDEEYIFSNNPLTVLYHEILEDKDLALYYINYIFQNEELKQCSCFCEYKKHELLGREIIERMSFEAMKKIVESDGEFIQHAREEWKDNKEIAMIAVKQNASNVKHISKRLKMDQEILLEGIKSDLREVLQYLTQDLLNDKHFILNAIEYNTNIVKYISNELQQDKEIWMKALSFRKSMKDTDIKFRKLKSMKDASFKVPLEFERDRDVFKLMIECEMIPEDLVFRNDRELMLEYVKYNSQELKELPYELKNDKQIVLNSVQHDDMSIVYASEQLQKDYDVIVQAIITSYDRREGVYSFSKLVETTLLEYKNDSQFMFEIITEGVKHDKQRALQIIELFPRFFKELPEELQCNIDFILSISNLESVLEFLPDEVFDNKELFTKILKTCSYYEPDYGNEYYEKCSNLRNDRDIILLLCELDISVSSYIDFDDWKSDKEIMNALIQKSVSYILEFQVNNYDFDQTLMELALRNIYNYANERFRDANLLSKIIDLLKELHLSSDILIDILIKIGLNKKDLEIIMKKYDMYEDSGKELAKRLIIHYFPSKVADTLLSDREGMLEFISHPECCKILNENHMLDLLSRWNGDEEFMFKASMINIRYMTCFSFNTVCKYLNKECPNKAHLIDYAVRFILNLNEEDGE